MEVRRFSCGDAEEISQMIGQSLRITNSPDYPAEEIEELAEFYSPAGVLRRAEESHMYVVCEAGRILGCGAISPYNGSERDSYIMTVFVLPGVALRTSCENLSHNLQKRKSV